MKDFQTSIGEIIDYIKPDKLILFGSRATGNGNTDSDYDLCVIKNIDNKRKLAQDIYKLLGPIGFSIDIIVETPHRFESNKNNPYLIDYEINKKGKIIYEKH